MKILTITLLFVLSYTNDLIELTKVINSECSICNEEEQLLIGSVILNRVRHPDFPKSIPEVIYQKDQFQGICSLNYTFSTKTVIAAAKILLHGPVNRHILYFHLKGTIPTNHTKKRIVLIKSVHHNFCI